MHSQKVLDIVTLMLVNKPKLNGDETRPTCLLSWALTGNFNDFSSSIADILISKGAVFKRKHSFDLLRYGQPKAIFKLIKEGLVHPENLAVLCELKPNHLNTMPWLTADWDFRTFSRKGLPVPTRRVNMKEKPQTLAFLARKKLRHHLLNTLEGDDLRAHPTIKYLPSPIISYLFFSDIDDDTLIETES